MKIILKITSLLDPLPDLSRQHFATCDHFNEQFRDIRLVKRTISLALSYKETLRKIMLVGKLLVLQNNVGEFCDHIMCLLHGMEINRDFLHFFQGTTTNHAESIDSDLQRGLDRLLRHTQH